MNKELKFYETHSFVIEKTYDGGEIVCYFKAWGGLKSNDRDVPDDTPEVEVWAYTVRCPDGNEVRVDTFDFADKWGEEVYIEGHGNMDINQYILDNLSELTS